LRIRATTSNAEKAGTPAIFFFPEAMSSAQVCRTDSARIAPLHTPQRERRRRSRFAGDR